MSPTIIAPPLLLDIVGSDTGDFKIAQWDAPGSAPGPPCYIAPLHLHHKDDEAWYVLEGKLCVRVGEDIVESGAGSCVFVPRGTKHTYWNPDSSPCRYLLIMTPKIHHLIQAIHAMTDKTPDKLRTLFEEYDSELL
ncbi:MAG TPA: cupin domain-containing protein [Capsulimonadaceae bacterium]|nr:cupin domain-containing protein [Capsulimonadaceae bacterium]